MKRLQGNAARKIDQSIEHWRKFESGGMTRIEGKHCDAKLRERSRASRRSDE
jgi:hypothetical protein